MSLFYDRNGHPMDVYEWGRKCEELIYKRLAETTLPNGRWVSTVWLGIDHSFGEGPPLIFETMVFSTKKNLDELDHTRHSTEAEAVAGHAAMVKKWKAKP